MRIVAIICVALIIVLFVFACFIAGNDSVYREQDDEEQREYLRKWKESQNRL